MKTFKKIILPLLENQVLIFGSNPEGRHGAGSAKLAMSVGAIYGKGRGIMGQAYGLITKNLTAGYVESETGVTYHKAGERSVSKSQILNNICNLYLYAIDNPDLDFLVVYGSGVNLNGYTPSEMGGLFSSLPIPNNIIFKEDFKKFINEH